MRSHASILLTVGMLLLAGLPAVSGLSPLSDGPAPGTADDPTRLPHGTYTGHILPGEEHWFAFHFDEGDKIDLRLFVTSGHATTSQPLAGMKLFLYTPEGRIADFVMAWYTESGREKDTIASEAGEWRVKITADDLGGQYRFTVDKAAAPDVAFAKPGNGYVVYGFEIGSAGGRVDTTVSAVHTHHNGPGKSMKWFLSEDEKSATFSGYAVGSEEGVWIHSEGEDVVNEELPEVGEYGSLVSHASTRTTVKPGTYYVIVFTKLADAYHRMEANLEGDARSLGIIHRGEEGLRTLSNKDFTGAFGASAPWMNIADDMTATVDVEHRLFGDVGCPSDTTCTFTHPDGTSENPGMYTKIVDGAPGTYTLEREVSSTSTDSMLLFAIDLELPGTPDADDGSTDGGSGDDGTTKPGNGNGGGNKKS